MRIYTSSRDMRADNFHRCVVFFSQCKKAVGVGRANRAGFAEIGKAYARMAKASVKMGNKDQAIAYLEDAQV